MKDHVRDDVRCESLETPLYKGFLLKKGRDERVLIMLIENVDSIKEKWSTMIKRLI